MRKINKWVSLAIMVLFIIHIVTGSFQMFGIIAGGTLWSTVVSYVMMALIAVHIIIGTWLTIVTLRVSRKSGASYPKENKLFWARRVSGFVMMIFIIFHIVIFTNAEAEFFRLKQFGTIQLVMSILLVISLIIHVLTNIKPLFVGLGTKRAVDVLVDVLIVLAILLLFSALAFVYYYYRWNLAWR